MMILLGLVIGCAVLFGLTLVPNRLRKPLIMAVTFLAGAFYALEFFWPTHAVVANRASLVKKFGEPTAASFDVTAEAQKAGKTLDDDAKKLFATLAPQDAELAYKSLVGGEAPEIKGDDVEKAIAQENFLTPYFKPVSDVSNVLQAFAIGLGIYSLISVHLRNVLMRRSGWGNSATLISAIFLMAAAHIGREYVKEGSLKALDSLLYDGLMKSLDATMFSIIAFYIISAAYRAFRIRSVEATILLVAAALVMLGNVPIGQALTNALPKDTVIGNLRIENIGGWILKRASSPATLAIDFGLGVGALATALRLWLSLERGSYFDEEL